MGSFGELLIDPDFLVNRFKETWGEFGWRLIHLSPPLLWAIAIPTMLSIAGLGFYVWTALRSSPWSGADPVASPAPWQGKALAILALTCAVAYLAVIQFGTEFALSQARYFFPVIVAGALLTMLGLRTLIPPPARPAGQGIIFAALILLNIVIMTGYVIPFTITFGDPIVTWSWGG